MTLKQYSVYDEKCRDIFKRYPVSACSLIHNFLRYIPEGEEGMEWYIGLSDEENDLVNEVKEVYKMWEL